MLESRLNMPIHALVRSLNELDIKKLAQVTEQNPICIVFTDRHGTIEYVNKAFIENTGYSKKELIGGNPRLLSSGYHDQKFYKNLWGTILKGNVWKGVLCNRRKSGEIYWEKAVIAPFFNDDKVITHFIGMKEDITEQVNAEKELLQYKEHLENIVSERTKELEVAKNRAELSDKLKAAFLSNISHEIRTPLNAIMGFSELLTMELELNDQQQEFFQIIKQNSEQLLNILEDIINMSQIQAGDLKLHYEPLDLKGFLLEVSEHFKKETEDKGLQWILELPSDPTICYDTDKLKLKQILQQLLKNAIKFTKTGSITMGLKKQDTSLLIYVKDTGIGITGEEQKSIFKDFTQSNHSLSRDFGGLGLGLSIVRSLVELLQGKITLESKAGEGSTFFVELPCRRND